MANKSDATSTPAPFSVLYPDFQFDIGCFKYHQYVHRVYWTYLKFNWALSEFLSFTLSSMRIISDESMMQ